jgi:hypothetical protein
MKLPVKITYIEWSGGACPYQIEGTTEDGDYFYLRYRGGRLRAGAWPTHKDFWNRDWSKESAYNIIDVQCGEPLDGMADEEMFLPLLKDKIIFPDDFKFGYDGYSSKQDGDPREGPSDDNDDGEQSIA